MTIKNTFSEISYKVAGTVIASIILGLGGLTYGFTVGNKVEKSSFDLHCLSNDRDFSQFQWEMGTQRSVNEVLLTEVEAVKKENQKLKIILEDINGKFNLIMYRLERIERKIDK